MTVAPRAGRLLCVLAGVALCSLAASASGQSANGSRVVERQPQGARRVGPASAKPSPPAAAAEEDPQKEQARQGAERDRLNVRIAALKAQIAAGEKSRSGASAALAQAERSLADVTKRLDELAQRQKAAQDLVAALDLQRSGTEGQIVRGQGRIGTTLEQLVANDARDPVEAYLLGDDPSEPGRTAVYLRYVAAAQASDLGALHARVTELQARRQRADDDGRALTQQAEAQRSAREALASDQAAQRLALAQISRKLAEQRDTANALEADEKRLSRVVERLQKIIEKNAAEERARREAARKRAEQEAAAAALRDAKRAARRTPSGEKPPAERPAPPARIEPLPDDAGEGAFAQLRGQLRLPVRGAITGRYGAARGSGSATWKGIFVKAEAGAEVRAVAAGKVIFADDLRGFGNLLIIDHGNQYLSIYGNNDTLLRRAGETVQSGDVVSRAGNSSGDDQTGLYFELRFRGRPYDPLPWIGNR